MWDVLTRHPQNYNDDDYETSPNFSRMFSPFCVCSITEK